MNRRTSVFLLFILLLVLMVRLTICIGKLTQDTLGSAEFVLSDFNYTAEVEEGQSVRVAITVTNVGEAEGNVTLVLRLDGEVLKEEEVYVPAETAAHVTWAFPAEVGIHTIDVDGFTGTFEVVEKLVPVSPLPKSWWEKYWGGLALGLLSGLLVLVGYVRSKQSVKERVF